MESHGGYSVIEIKGNELDGRERDLLIEFNKLMKNRKRVIAVAQLI